MWSSTVHDGAPLSVAVSGAGEALIELYLYISLAINGAHWCHRSDWERRPLAHRRPCTSVLGRCGPSTAASSTLYLTFYSQLSVVLHTAFMKKNCTDSNGIKTESYFKSWTNLSSNKIKRFRNRTVNSKYNNTCSLKTVRLIRGSPSKNVKRELFKSYEIAYIFGWVPRTVIFKGLSHEIFSCFFCHE